jgi:hypothetical protein
MGQKFSFIEIATPNASKKSFSSISDYSFASIWNLNKSLRLNNVSLCACI